MGIGPNIALARRKAGRSKRWLAEQLGRSRSWLSRMERGQVGINAETLRRICQVLDASADDVLELCEHAS